MFKNFLLLTVRSLLANRLFTAINIIGLAVGLACVIFIALFVRHETSYDQHWTNADRTYKVMRTFFGGSRNQDLELATNAPQTGPLLAQDFPFERVVRLMSPGPLILTDTNTNQSVSEEGLYFTDPNVHEIFDIPLVEGDWETALDGPFRMVINESLANQYFPQGDAVGASLLLAGQAPVQITGVMENLPENTHLAGQAFVSIESLVVMFGEGFLENWSSNNFHTYVVTPPDYDISNFVESLPDFLNRHISEEATTFTRFEVLPLKDIHLHSQRDNELQANGNITTVITFSVIAVVILMIACFNFMNLSTARSASRAREVGLRKTLGAERSHLIVQFLGESVMLCAVAVMMAVVLVSVLLGWFNNLIGLELTFNPLQDPVLIVGLLFTALLVGLAAGSYPAFFLSSFPASKILRGELNRGSGGARFRRVLVVTQFAISIALVIASGIALSQLRYALTMDPGFTKDQVIIVSSRDIEGLGTEYQVMKQQLLSHPEIISVSAANLMPGDQNTNSDGVRYEGYDSSVDPFIGMSYLNVDYDFFETFDIELIAGRSFSEERGTDIFVEPSEENPQTTGSYVLNAMAAELIGYSPEQAINKWFEVSRQQRGTVRGPIIGVADNIYFSSIRDQVNPVYYRVMESWNSFQQFSNFRQMAVRVTGNNLSDTVSDIEAIWKQFRPSVPYEQEFLDQRFQQLYQAERRQSQLFTAFSVMAIFIASLGLFGLASYMTEQRTKEIGIRKVLGGSVFQITTLLTQDFSKLVLLANVIAWPAAWYFMNNWLESFAYRVSLGVGIFVFAAFLAWLIAAATVGSLSAITANANPTQSLRHE
jgi:putative ABC transport system permease protein